MSGQITGLDTTPRPVSVADHNIRECIVQSHKDNTEDVLVGNSSNQYLIIEPGQSITVPIISLSLLYIKYASGSGGVVNYFARD